MSEVKLKDAVNWRKEQDAMFNEAFDRSRGLRSKYRLLLALTFIGDMKPKHLADLMQAITKQLQSKVPRDHDYSFKRRIKH